MFHNRVESVMIDEHFLVVAAALARSSSFYLFAYQNIDLDGSSLLPLHLKQVLIFYDEVFVQKIFL